MFLADVAFNQMLDDGRYDLARRTPGCSPKRDEWYPAAGRQQDQAFEFFLCPQTGFCQ